jgi:radical SAM protein with 4Fe4S-binding SPASM domain
LIDCAAMIDLGSPEHMARFTRRAMSERVPFSGAFDLTYRCNLRCVHCYCGHAGGQTAAGASELGTDAALRLLREAADAGCLFMLLSGGEPLLRRDFTEIYLAACRLGIRTTVFTNATLLDERVLAAFRDYPPYLVEVSVYGRSQAVYEAVSGVRGSHAKAMAGIHLLLGAGVRVGLKTMILRDNLNEVAAIESLADDLGCAFRLDALVTPRLDGDPAPLEQRVDPRVAASLELASEKRKREAAAFRDRQMAEPDTPDLFRCRAGVMGFHLDPQGVLRPCLMSQQYGVDAVEMGFAAAWASTVETMRGLRREEDSRCSDCEWRALCGYCPSLFALETGSAHQYSPYVCGLGEQRVGIIDATCEAGRS